MRSRWRVGLLSILGATTLATSPATAAPPDHLALTPVPAPSWDAPLELPASTRSSTTAGAVEWLLLDRQVRLGDEVHTLRRYAGRARSAEGLHELADVRVPFDPSYQRVEWHAVDVVRDGVRQARLATTPAKLIQQEEDLSARIYDGRQAYILFIDDLRVGDVLDVRYALIGLQPALGGRYTTTEVFARSAPVGVMRQRVLAPVGRPLHVRVTAPTLVETRTEADGWRDQRWVAQAVPAHVSEDRTPGWYEAVPLLSLSEEPSWDAVRERFRALYEGRLDTPITPELQAQIERIRAEHGSPEARLLAAVRWAQREVRYFGIELGEGSLIPSTPGVVFARRFGDCKDKSVLLIALLRGLGIEAAPALVSTTARRGLDHALPSAYAFDHVIVRSRLGGVERWHDATDTTEHGTLATLAPPPFERALVLDAGEADLATIPPPREPARYEVEERYVVGADGRVEFTVYTVATQHLAVDLRRSMAESRDTWQRNVLQFYARRDPSLAVRAPIAVEEEDRTGALTVVESYTIDSLWSEGRRPFYSDAISGSLGRPSTVRRTTPLWIEHPVVRRHTVIVERPEPWDVREQPQRIEGPGFVLTEEDEVDGNRLRVAFEYRSKADHVAAEDMLAHLSAIDRSWRIIEWSLRDHGAPRPLRWVTMVPVAVVLLVALSAWIAYRRINPRVARATPPPVRTHGAGESASTALRAAPSGAELARRACPGCKARGRWRGAGEDSVRLGERRMRVMKLECEACERPVSLFVETEG